MRDIYVEYKVAHNMFELIYFKFKTIYKNFYKKIHYLLKTNFFSYMSLGLT